MVEEEMNTELDRSMKDWEDLSTEYLDLEEMHNKYRTKLEELISLQKKCASGVKHQRYRLSAIESLMSHVDGHQDHLIAKSDLKKDILRRKAQLSQMEDYLPRNSGRYLKIILGNVNVSILDKDAKYQYKEEYEQFKLSIMLIGFILSGINLFVNNRILDLCLLFLIVWYYCTLTIRESILRVNGSRIKGWWRAHHFITTVCGGVLLVWPDGDNYQSFRTQLMWFNIYLGFLSYMQFTYQRGCLYRLKSLGVRNNDMDITIDGFHSWMWKGLSFLLPFLAFGYGWQLYNSYVLYHLSLRESAEWQVTALSLLFATLGMGNIITTSWTITAKIRDRQMGYFKLRFTRLDKYFWTHKRRGTQTLLAKNYSRGAERIRKTSEMRLSPGPSFVNVEHSNPLPGTAAKTDSAVVAEDSPDYQLLMAPRTLSSSSGTEDTSNDISIEDTTGDDKKDN